MLIMLAPKIEYVGAPPPGLGGKAELSGYPRAVSPATAVRAAIAQEFRNLGTAEES